jgi:pyruvate formate lyase activating enzyme
LDGVVVTGGEPCLDPGLPELLRTLKREGMPVKLDTNGSVPDVLEQLLAARLVDYVAVDVKGTPEGYERAVGIRNVWPLVQRSIEAVIDSDVDHEFRTTCYPLAVGVDDPVRIASLVQGGRRYVLQQFRPTRTLDPAATSVRPHSPETLCRAAERCGSYLPTTVRGG